MFFFIKSRAKNCIKMLIFFLPCSLFLLSSSFTIFLGLSFTTASTFPIQRELMLLEVLLAGSYLFRLFDVVNNPFTQREKPRFPLVDFVITQPHILKTLLSSINCKFILSGLKKSWRRRELNLVALKHKFMKLPFFP